MFSAARLCATDIATNFSLRGPVQKLSYIRATWVIHHVIRPPRYSSADNGAGDGSRTPISWRNRFSRRALAVRPFRGGSTSAWNSSHFRWKYLRKHLTNRRAASCRVFRAGDYREERFIAEKNQFEASSNTNFHPTKKSLLKHISRSLRIDFSSERENGRNNGFNYVIKLLFLLCVIFLILIETNKKGRKKGKENSM